MPPSNLSTAEIRSRLRGPVASIPTPFDAAGEIDFDGIARIIDTAVAGGSDVILLTAGDSQFLFMTDQEIAEVTRFAVTHTAGRALTVAATGDWATRVSVPFAGYCRELGADVLMSMAPQQINSGTGLVAHYRQLAAVMPVMVVGYPEFAVLDALHDEPNVCCMKEDGAEAYAIELLQKYGARWTVMTGGGLHRHLFEWPFGAQAYMDWSTSYAPQVSAAYWQALLRGDLAAAREVTVRVERPLFDLAGELGAVGWHLLWHAMLSLNGIAERYLRLPAPTATDAQLARIREVTEPLGLIGG